MRLKRGVRVMGDRDSRGAALAGLRRDVAPVDASPGWPPDGVNGEFIGWDATGRLCVLRWSRFRGGSGAWLGVRFDPAVADTDPQYPQMFRRAPETESFVVLHAPAQAVRG